MRPSVHHISGFAQHYDWGDVQQIHDLRGTTPDGHPLAEIWFGTHRDGPSRLEDGTLLEDVVAPRREGCPVDGLPYMVKYIAPAKPLSIQVHPSLAQAAAGFDLEEKLGIDISAENRTFKDRNHKPEMLLALTPWRALVGFAEVDELIRFNDALNIPAARRIAMELRERGLSDAVKMTWASGLRPARDDIATYSQRCAELADHDDPKIAKRATTIAQVAEHFPLRASILVASLMNIVELQPGQVLFTPTGTVHAYLSGLGLEVMASSANTVRAGLTNKHIDVDGLLSTARIISEPPVLIDPQVSTVCGSRITSYQPEVDDFHLEVAELSDCEISGSTRSDTIITSIRGTGTINGETIEQGHAVWVPSNVDFILEGAAGLAVISCADLPVVWDL